MLVQETGYPKAYFDTNNELKYLNKSEAMPEVKKAIYWPQE